LAAILALAVLAAFPDVAVAKLALLSNGWIEELTTAEAFELALAVAVLKFGMVRLLLQWWPLRLWLTPGIIKSRRVRRRAVRYFKVGAERRTTGRTGILIYLSLSEHRAEIVADEAIHSKVDPELWGQAMVDMIGHVREGRTAQGMEAAIRDVGDILANHFPRDAADMNELPDRVIEL
jgi:putative membrane protein